MIGSNMVNDLDTPTGERERKAYFTLAAQYALAGLELVTRVRQLTPDFTLSSQLDQRLTANF